MLEERRKNYNHYRPHSALDYMTPVEFATKWQEENRGFGHQRGVMVASRSQLGLPA